MRLSYPTADTSSPKTPSLFRVWFPANGSPQRVARDYFTRISAAAHGLVRTPRPRLGDTAGMKTTVMPPVKAFTLVALGLAIAAMGIYVADADDAPGAAVIGMLLMVVGVVLGVKTARNRLPTWAARTALAVGVGAAALAAFLTHDVTARAALFPQAQEVPSVVDPACAQPYWSKTCPGCPWRSVPAAPSSGPKGSDGGTS
jgi:peptidoglycan/LPS O-acetylase OafA/YrhL